MNKKFWLWMIGINILGITGYKILTGFGAAKNYEFITNELDTGDTIIMTKPDGTTIAVKKIKHSDEE